MQGRYLISVSVMEGKSPNPPGLASLEERKCFLVGSSCTRNREARRRTHSTLSESGSRELAEARLPKISSSRDVPCQVTSIFEATNL